MVRKLTARGCWGNRSVFDVPLPLATNVLASSDMIVSIPLLETAADGGGGGHSIAGVGGGSFVPLSHPRTGITSGDYGGAGVAAAAVRSAVTNEAAMTEDEAREVAKRGAKIDALVRRRAPATRAPRH